MVNMGILAIIKAAFEAEVSLIPDVSKKKYMVIPKRLVAMSGRISCL